MFAKTIRRVVLVIPTIILISLLSFTLLYFSPGDTAMLILKERTNVSTITAEDVQEFEESKGLNAGYFALYSSWLGGVLKGDLGTSYVDGQSINSDITAALNKTLKMSLIAWVVYTAAGTANNIRIGRPDAGSDEIVEAARRAGCHDFIANLERGYDTVVGEAGARLSGGEKQRISIARALLKDAPIVLLDEVTANVDVENEQKIQLALQELLKDRTVIIIAHKLSTIRNVDQILVIENGQISQKGCHDDLIEKEGLYKRLWEMQYETSRWRV